MCLVTQLGAGKIKFNLVYIRKFAASKEIVSKMKEIIEGDARFTVCDIARKVGMSLSTVHLILKNI